VIQFLFCDGFVQQIQESIEHNATAQWRLRTGLLPEVEKAFERFSSREDLAG